MSVGYVDILQTLVGFRTVSSQSNLELIDWVRNYLDGYGVASRLTFNAERSKANLFATLGAPRPGGLILSGHTDVVPVDGQQWHGDPFVATLSEGRLYGRGTCDMKGFIAVALSLVPEFLAMNLCHPIYLALSFDEEIGCLGVRALLSDLAQQDLRPHSCIVGEPTGMRVVTAHKGAGMYSCEIRGREVHSSLAPRGVNAIHYAAMLIEKLEATGARLAIEECRHPGFDIPYSTIQINQIRGGSAGNTVAGHCRFTIDIRHLPGTSRQDLMAELHAYIDGTVLPRMRSVEPECHVELHEIADIPAFSIEASHPLVQHVRGAMDPAGECGCVAFGTEAGLFQRAGIPTVVCGPGQIEQAHRPNEFVFLEQLQQCRQFLQQLTGSGRY